MSVLPPSSATITYEIKSAGEATLDLNELILTVRRIAAKSENVLYAVGLNSLKSVIDLLDGHVRARQMHHRLDAYRVLHPVRDVKREIGRGATRPPSDVAECRVVGHHTVHPLEQVLDAIFRLRREEFEGEDDLVGGYFLLNLVYYLHFWFGE